LTPTTFVNQLEHLNHIYGIRHFEIVDDIFNARKQRVMEICRQIIDRNLKIRLAFPNGLRSDLLDDETIDALYNAGTRFICFAIESASPRIQKMVNKHLDLEKARRAIDYAASKRIICCGFFMMGFPTETLEELQATCQWAVQSRLHLALFYLLTPYRGTAISQSFQIKDKKAYTFYNYDYGTATISDLPFDTIKRLRMQTTLRFHIHPKRLARLVRDYPLLHRMPVTVARMFLRMTRRLIMQSMIAS
jgi:radical SAM superfamily enzyme YgiQ (UPF0313 family)